MSKVMIFKHEDEVNGVPIGPLTEGTVNELGYPVGGLRPFDPDREPDPWVTLTDARRTARRLGLALYET
jgi:hypothetical protein